MNKMMGLCLSEVIQNLQSGEMCSVEFTSAYAENIQADGADDMFSTLTLDMAIKTAEWVDQARMRGQSLPALAGVPMVLSDLISVKGVPHTCGSPVMRGYVAPYNAAVVEQLQHCPLLAKTAVGEFGMGAAIKKSDSSLEKGMEINGAAAVATHMTGFGLDVFGGFTVPNSSHRVVSLKPTYGSVSRYGLAAVASSFEQIGPVARTVAGAKLVYQSIAGTDLRDVTTTDSLFHERDARTKPLRIGLLEECLESASTQAREALTTAAETLENNGHIVERIFIPSVHDAPTIFDVLASAEAYSNMARYDGIRFGQVEDGGYHGTQNLRQHFGQCVKQRILLGNHVLQKEHRDLYQAAQQAREAVTLALATIFDSYHVLLGPTVDAPLTQEHSEIGGAGAVPDGFGAVASLIGAPVLYMCPQGQHTGVQLMAHQADEGLLFGIGQELEAGKNER